MNRQLIGPKGRVGCVVPSGIATDDTTKFFFQDLIHSTIACQPLQLRERGVPISGVHHSTKFCLLTLTGPQRPHAVADFVFFARRVEHLHEADRHFTLSADDIRLMNPNTGTCPIFRSKRDAEINKAIYRRVPVLIREGDSEVNPWGISLSPDARHGQRLWAVPHAGAARGRRLGPRWQRSSVEASETYLPLYEAKMVHHFDHRFGTYEGQTDSQANQGKLPELDERSAFRPRSRHPTVVLGAEDGGRTTTTRQVGPRMAARLAGHLSQYGHADGHLEPVPRAAIGHTFLLMLPIRCRELVTERVPHMPISLPTSSTTSLVRRSVGRTSRTH